MSYEVFTGSVRELPVRLKEVQEMLEALLKDPTNLTAKIDLNHSNVRMYAKKLGYKVKTKAIDKNNSYVWLEAIEQMRGNHGDSK